MVCLVIDALKCLMSKYQRRMGGVVRGGGGIILSTKFYLMNPTVKCRSATW